MWPASHTHGRHMGWVSGERFKVFFFCLSKHLKMECLQGSINHKCSSSLSTLLGKASFLGHVFLLPHSLGMGLGWAVFTLDKIASRLSIYTRDAINKGLKMRLFLPHTFKSWTTWTKQPSCGQLFFMFIFNHAHSILHYLHLWCLRLFPLVKQAR